MHINIFLNEKEIDFVISSLCDARINYSIQAQEYVRGGNFEASKKLRQKINGLLDVEYKICEYKIRRDLEEFLLLKKEKEKHNRFCPKE